MTDARPSRARRQAEALFDRSQPEVRVTERPTRKADSGTATPTRRREAPAASWVHYSELVPWKGNPYRHPREQLDLIKASIRPPDGGAPAFTRTIVARRANKRLIAGHGSLEAATELFEADPAFRLPGAPGPGMLPVRLLDVSQDRADALAIADNESPSLRERDDPALRQVLAALEESNAALLGSVGMTADLVQQLLKPAPRPSNTPAPPPPPPPSTEPDSRPGRIYELGPHRLICGDSMDPDTVDRLLDGAEVGHVLTDPPYTIYGSSTGLSSDVADDKMVEPFFRAILRLAESRLPLFGTVHLCCDWRSWSSWWTAARSTRIEIKNMLVWNKGGSGLGSNYANCHELIVYGINMPPDSNVMRGTGAIRGIKPILRPNVLNHARPTGDDRPHNASKPVPLLLEIIDGLPPGDLLEPFGGGGSTLIAAAKAGRRCYVVEKEPKWCDVIRNRWATWAEAAGVDPGPGSLSELPA